MFVKVCGISNFIDAQYVNESDADAIGFVLGGPVFPVEVEPPAQIVRKTIAGLRRSLLSVLVTHLQDPEEILALADYLQCKAIQISEPLKEAAMDAIRRGCRRTIIKTVAVAGEASADYLQRMTPFCDYILLDSQSAGYIGGTGIPNDWNICRDLAEISQKPVLLAGGLSPSNLATAIERVRPYGVDVSTGVSTFSPFYPRKDRKDRDQINAFISISRSVK